MRWAVLSIAAAFLTLTAPHLKSCSLSSHTPIYGDFQHALWGLGRFISCNMKVLYWSFFELKKTHFFACVQMWVLSQKAQLFTDVLVP